MHGETIGGVTWQCGQVNRKPRLRRAGDTRPRGITRPSGHGIETACTGRSKAAPKDSTVPLLQHRQCRAHLFLVPSSTDISWVGGSAKGLEVGKEQDRPLYSNGWAQCPLTQPRLTVVSRRRCDSSPNGVQPCPALRCQLIPFCIALCHRGSETMS
ncbi:hypothetical protein N656DRAFT_214312 [Canariomyces notabilis]|uniref:Uncharacterized protein n=1 Tax=Canariomyces notabilis TaxID=2074819 RepID=A0AAN6QQD3_9PEZI|nr:hypothetical protein N656DRAFT_214312 [Canariomyces arenarius]